MGSHVYMGIHNVDKTQDKLQKVGNAQPIFINRICRGVYFFHVADMGRLCIGIHLRAFVVWFSNRKNDLNLHISKMLLSFEFQSACKIQVDSDYG